MRRLFGREITKAIIDVFKPDATLVTVQIGDISYLPSPDNIATFLPAILVSPQTVELKAIDGDQRPSMYLQRWPFILYYAMSYDPDNADYVGLILDEAQAKAEILMDDLLLGGVVDIPGGGLIIGSAVEKIDFDTQVTDFYKSLNIDIACALIHYCVYFRNYKA